MVAQQQSDGSILVRWRALPGAAKYQVTRSVPPAASQVVATVPDTSYTDTNVQAGSSYYYLVGAFDSSGVIGLKAGSQPVASTMSASGPAPSLAAGGTTGGTGAGGTGGTATTGGATGPAPVAPTGIHVEDFSFPKVSIFWGFTQSGMSYRIDRGAMPYAGKGSPTWQTVATTPPLDCCMWSIVDSAVTPSSSATYGVYRVTTVDPAAPARTSTPVVSSQVRVAPISKWSVSSSMWLLYPIMMGDRAIRVGTSFGTQPVAMSSNPAIVTVDPNGNVVAKSPGVAYLITMKLYQDAHPVVQGWRLTVTP